MTFGEKLLKLRKEKGLSQETLAEQIGTTRQAVSKWENNQGFPETEKLIKSLDKKATPKKKKEELKNDFVYRDLEDQLKMITGTKVTINRKSEKAGKIEIEYYTPEDLEKIVALLNN